jgi:hypothetical protein
VGNITMDVTRRDVRMLNLARDKDKWWALVNTVMNLRLP